MPRLIREMSLFTLLFSVVALKAAFDCFVKSKVRFAAGGHPFQAYCSVEIDVFLGCQKESPAFDPSLLRHEEMKRLILSLSLFALKKKVRK